MFGNPHTGFKFYGSDLNVDIIRGSDEQYFTSRFLAGYMFDLLHSFTSIEGRTEAFNQLLRDTEKSEYFQNFIANNPAIGGHFNSKEEKQSIEAICDQDQDEEEDQREERSAMHELHKPTMRTAFYNHEIRCELEERGILDSWTFGPKENEKDGFKKMSYRESLEVFMEQVDVWRRGEIYPHDEADCSMDCKARGCQQAVVVDGCWKLAYRVSVLLQL